MYKDRLSELLQPVRKRMRWIRVVEYGTAGVVCGFAASFLWLGLAFFVVIPGFRLAVLPIIGLGLLGGVSYALWCKDSDLAAARAADSVRGEETLQTAVQFRAEDSPVILMQRDNAVEYGEWVVQRLPDLVPLPSIRRKIWILAVVSCLLAVILLVPNPMDDKIAANAAERKWIEEQTLELKNLETKLAETLSPIVRKPLEEKLAKLEAALVETPDAQQALEEMAETLEEFDRMQTDLQKEIKKTEQLADQLLLQPDLQSLGESLQQADAEQMKAEIDKLGQLLQKMTPEEKAALSKQLEKLAADAGNEQLKQAAQDMAKALSEGGSVRAA